MSRMFSEYEDQNGVSTSCNAHPTKDYEPRRLKGYVSHPMLTSEGVVYMDRKPPTLEHEVGDQVLRQIGSRNGTMSFGSLLAEGEKR